MSEIDLCMYEGKYGDIARSYEIAVEDETGLTVSDRTNINHHTGTDARKNSAFPLKFAGDDTFVLDSTAISPMEPRRLIPFKFVNLDQDGRMQHIAFGGRLLRRFE